VALKYGKEKRKKMFYRELLLSPHTFEEYSADAGDYWNVNKNHVFKDSTGEDMVLVGDKVSTDMANQP
jgi:hypothetical protein